MMKIKKKYNEKFGVDCGIDEAGRGPWAGPVVAAAVILNNTSLVSELDDSKKLSSLKREYLFEKIADCSQVGIGFSSVVEIDKINILEATFLAMTRAIQALPKIPKRVLIDGNLVPRGLPCQAIPIVKGDSKIVSIAAASIVAKVTRDKHMKNLSRIYPGYGWERNFGYGVKEHKKAIELLGITPQHRYSFKPIHNMLC